MSDLPLLGEPLAIELTNTQYGTFDEAIDFLADAERATDWVRAALNTDLTLTDADAWALRELRDAVRSLVIARCDGLPPDPAAVGVVNRSAAACGASPVLVWSPGERPWGRVERRGPPPAQALSVLATSCIALCVGEHPIRRCEGPGCSMFFVPEHGRRRFCHDSCSHRGRQSRYRRSN
jgi:predicted RNA-binding Zn ribbon-like protein